MIRADTKYKKVSTRLKTELMGRYVNYTKAGSESVLYVISDFKSNSKRIGNKEL